MRIGDRLASPTNGYKRIDGNAENIKTYGTGFYSGTNNSYGYYNNSYIATTKANDYYEFAVYTTNLRIFVKMDNTCTELPETHDIYIDGTLIASVSSYLNIAPGSTSGQRLLFEKINMSKSLYTIRIVNKTDGYLVLDCIDIDSKGVLTLAPPYKLKQLELNLTSDDSNGCLVTNSPPLSSSLTGFNAFNGIDIGQACYHSVEMTGKGFIILRLPTKKKLKSVIYKTRDSTHYWYTFPNFYIYGSNDGTEYTLIKSIVSSSWAKSSSYPIDFYYNQYSYRWYKFEADIHNSWYTCGEIELFIPSNPYFIKTDSKLIGGNNTEFDLDSNLSNLLTNGDNFFDLPDLTPLTNNKYKVMKIVSV